MKSYRFYFDKDKHEAYLNQMSEQGWALTSYAYGIHAFEPCEKGQYAYRFDLIDPNNAYESEKEDYVQFVEETGAVMVAELSKWYLFRKDTAAGPFELYTDLSSKILYYGRIRTMYAGFALTSVIVALNPLLSYIRTGYGPFLLSAALFGGIGLRPALAVRSLSKKITGLKAHPFD